MNRIIPIALAGVAVVAAGYFVLNKNSADSPSNGLTAVAQSTDTDTAIAAAPMSSDVTEMVLGNADAPITIIEYASYTCPHCASFHENVFGDLKSEYIDTGKVKFVMREVYFDRQGLWAGLLARCEGPSKYFGVSDLLFKRQREWSSGDSGAAIAENLYKLGRIAGMDNDAMAACLQDKDKAEALVAEFQRTTQADGVNSTPSFIINGEKHANQSLADMREILDGLLAE
jgi:protein-disulfide isomerase